MQIVQHSPASIGQFAQHKVIFQEMPSSDDVITLALLAQMSFFVMKIPYVLLL